METQTADTILNNDYTIKDALRIIPYLSELVNEIGYDDQQLESYKFDQEGDINELILLYLRDAIENTSVRWDTFMVYQKEIMESCSIMGFEEYESNSLGWRSFKSMYPNLAKTMLVWGWS